MDRFTQFSMSQFETPVGNLVNDFLRSGKTAQEWQSAREQASGILQEHTAELRELMMQMQSFSHETSVEKVMAVQSRTAALRWLIQSIEQEVQRLDKAYREVAQVEQFHQDKMMLLT